MEGEEVNIHFTDAPKEEKVLSGTLVTLIDRNIAAKEDSSI